MSGLHQLPETLPVLQRFALTYAPASSRAQILGLMALDSRLADILRAASEPMLAQLRMTWWRETLSRPAGQWPEGEPLLAALRFWSADHAVLARLAEGWEAMTEEKPLRAVSMAQLARARADAFAALGEDLADAETADRSRSMARCWAMVDIASGLSDPQEQQVAWELARAEDWRKWALPGALRPIVVLHGLAASCVEQRRNLGALPARTMIKGVRLGLLGR